MKDTKLNCSSDLFFLLQLFKYITIIITTQRASVEKQLPDRTKEPLRTPSSFLMGLLGVDLIALGESRLRRTICFIAEIKCSVESVGVDELNFMQKFICRFKASSLLIILPDRKTSSLIASAHSPQIHLP